MESASSRNNAEAHGSESLAEWPVEELESVPDCPICGSHDRALLYDGLTDRVFGVAPGKWTLYRCARCESAWLDPRPTRESIGLAYANYYTHDASDHPIVRRKGGLRTFLHDAMNDYRNTRYGLKRAPSNCLGRWIIPLVPSLRAAVDAECRHLPSPPPGGGRLLEVGFGNGGFLKLATEAGWSAEGIDPDQKAVEAARSRGLNVRCASAEDLKSESGSYDMIVLCHVIEHVHDPLLVLRELYRLLTPGGTLWLDTPNLNSKGHRKFGRYWRDLDPPRHLVIFGSESLISILGGVGFVGVRRRWRGLSVFDVFPVSEAIKYSRDTRGASRNGKPPIGEVFAELHEMFFSKDREFITITAVKPVES
ncbi:class I SAM-dependent methyltransferase [Geopseudomonas aromaticivorans]